MELILWRHADAADGEPDAARPLTERGRSQAETMARWLTPRLPADLRILVSPARRAQETARALERPFETIEEISTSGDAGSLLRAAGWPDAAQAVLLVGHQPTLGETAALLLAGNEKGDATLFSGEKRVASPFSFRIAKGAVWWLRGRRRGNATETRLMLALEPEMLEREGH